METKEKLSNIVNFSNVIGEFKFEQNKTICNTRINLDNNEFLKIENQELITLFSIMNMMSKVKEKIKNTNCVYI